MRIEIRSRGLTLSKKQTLRLRQDLSVVFARFGERIDRVIVVVSASLVTVHDEPFTPF